MSMGILQRILFRAGFTSNVRWTEQEALKCKLFLHVPKTAGTSFRAAAEDFFGPKRIVRDYFDDPETSGSIRDTVRASGDPLQIIEAIRRDRATMLFGHFNVGRYCAIFGIGNAMTILRDPVTRVISHYRHAVRHQGYGRDLMTFARHGEFRNLQSRMLRNLDPAVFGIVGITERYELTLSAVAHHWGWQLAGLRKNVGDEQGQFSANADEQQLIEIGKLNSDDQRLYDRAQFVVKNTDYCVQKGISLEPRGGFLILQPGRIIRGFGYVLGSDEPLKVRLVINGNEQGLLDCTNLSPHLSCWSAPRRGYIGFWLPDVKPDEGDVIELYDAVHDILLERRAVPAPG